MVTMMAKLCVVVGGVILLLLFAAVQVRASEVQLAWEPPSADTEEIIWGTLVGYRLYYGLYDGEPTGNFQAVIDVGQQSTYTVTGLTPGETYSFGVTAYDNAGNETEFSNITIYSVPLPGEIVEPDPEDGEDDLAAIPEPELFPPDGDDLNDPDGEAAEE